MRDMEVISMYIEALTNTYTQPVNQAANQRVEMPKTTETSKAESTDGGVNVSIAKEADESVTLSIMADERLVDEQKNVDMDRLKKVMEQEEKIAVILSEITKIKSKSSDKEVERILEHIKNELNCLV